MCQLSTGRAARSPPSRLPLTPSSRNNVTTRCTSRHVLGPYCSSPPQPLNFAPATRCNWRDYDVTKRPVRCRCCCGWFSVVPCCCLCGVVYPPPPGWGSLHSVSSPSGHIPPRSVAHLPACCHAPEVTFEVMTETVTMPMKFSLSYTHTFTPH